ncbi:MAG: hypothetical protein ACLVHV_10190 [Oscillospiraceae bacterium]
MGVFLWAKKKFAIEEKIKAVELHIREGMGYGGISERFGVPITTLCHWVRKIPDIQRRGVNAQKRQPILPGRVETVCRGGISIRERFHLRYLRKIQDLLRFAVVELN